MDQIGKINGLVALLGYLCIGVMAGRAVEESPSAAFRFAEADNKAVPDFQKHVIPLLGKLGCSSAKCHGSFQGQGDFRLSLFVNNFIWKLSNRPVMFIRFGLGCFPWCRRWIFGAFTF